LPWADRGTIQGQHMVELHLGIRVDIFLIADNLDLTGHGTDPPNDHVHMEINRGQFLPEVQSIRPRRAACRCRPHRSRTIAYGRAIRASDQQVASISRYDHEGATGH
jgi:hypothetical protein